MRYRPHICVLLLGIFFATGCPSEKDLAKRAAVNFYEADRVHGAPFRSYLFATDQDKESMSAETYADWHAAQAWPGVAEVRVESLNVSGRDGSAVVALDEKRVDAVLQESDGRWRLFLGLDELESTGRHLRRSEEARADGRYAEALRHLEDLDDPPPRGALVRELMQEVEDEKGRLIEEVAAEELAKRFEAAKEMNLERLDGELPKLKRDAAQAWEEELGILETRLKSLRIADARENLRLEKETIRQYYEGNALMHDYEVELKNASSVAIGGLIIDVEMLQRGEPLGVREIKTEIAPPLGSGESRVVRLRIEDSSQRWKSRDFAVDLKDVEIVDE